MKTMLKVLKYELRDVLRSKALLLYALFFLVATDLLFRFTGDSARALLSLVNVTLLVVPLISIILGTMFVYNAREFNELLLSQPVNRKQLFGGLYLGLALPMCAAFVAGVAVPAMIHGVDEPSHIVTIVMLGVAGVFLTSIFTALSYAVAFRVEDRVSGMGMALILWLGLAVVYDGIVLLVANTFYIPQRPTRRPSATHAHYDRLCRLCRCL